MSKPIACALAACVVLAGAAALLAASVQDRTQQPGQPTQGKVWIQNRGDEEAVPVTVHNVATGPPLRVQIAGAPTVSIVSGSIVGARVVRQAWEYRDVSIPAGQDPAAILNTAGADGWEASGVVSTDQRGTVVIMKRPR